MLPSGMRQTTKQYGNQIQNRLDILNQNRGPGSSHPELPPVTPPPELKAGIDIIKQVSDGKMSPPLPMPDSPPSA